MSPVPVTIRPRTRPDLPGSLVATDTLLEVGDLGDLMEGNMCSCSGSDDNPH
jgi:hypothetical protein